MARFLEAPEVIEKYKQYHKNVRVRVLIDWFDALESDNVDLETNNLEDYMIVFEDTIEDLSLTRSLEGVEATSIRDDCSATLIDPKRELNPFDEITPYFVNDRNFVEPMKYVIIQIKVEGTEWLNYYSGLLTDINKSRFRGDVSLEISDMMFILQQKDCPDRMEFNIVGEGDDEILEPIESYKVASKLLDECKFISYDMESLENVLTGKILYNFGGMNVFGALNMIAQKNNSYFFMRGDELTFKSKMFMAEEGVETVEYFSDKEKVKESEEGYTEFKENLFEINKTVNRDNIFNEVKISAEPYSIQARPEKVWIGGEDTVDVEEEYRGSDIGDITTVTITEDREVDLIEDITIAPSSYTRVIIDVVDLKEDYEGESISTNDIAIFLDLRLEGDDTEEEHEVYFNYQFLDSSDNKVGDEEEIQFVQFEGRQRVRVSRRNIGVPSNEEVDKIEIIVESDTLSSMTIEGNFEDSGVGYTGRNYIVEFFDWEVEGRPLQLTQDPETEENASSLPDSPEENQIVAHENVYKKYINGEWVESGEEGFIMRTRNVPIVPRSLGVAVGSDFYTEGDGLLAVDNKKGIVIFDEEGDIPEEDDILTVSYDYFFTQLRGVLDDETEVKRRFTAELEYPCARIDNLEDNLVAYSLDDETPMTKSVHKKVSLGTISASHSSGDSYVEDTNRITIPEGTFNIKVDTDCRVRHDSYRAGIPFTSAWTGRVGQRLEAFTYYNIGDYPEVDKKVELDALPYSDDGRGDEYLRLNQDVRITNEDFGKDFWISIEGSFTNVSRPTRDADITFPWGRTRNVKLSKAITDEQEEQEEIEIEVIQIGDDHGTQSVICELINRSEERVQLFTEIEGEEEQLLVITGQPIKQQEKFNITDIDLDSVDKYKIEEQLSIENDLFRDEEGMDKLKAFLLFNYAKPKVVSNIRMEAGGYPHLELLDKIYIEEDRDSKVATWYLGTEVDLDRDVDSTYNLDDKGRLFFEDLFGEEAKLDVFDDRRFALIHEIHDSIRDGIWEQDITAIEFDDTWVYERDRGRSPISSQPAPFDRITQAEPVTNIDVYIKETRTSKDGTYNARLFADWDNPSNLYHDYVEVYIKRGEQDWKEIGTTSGESFEQNIVPADSYRVAFVSVNRTNERMSFANAPNLEPDVIEKDKVEQTTFKPEVCIYKNGDITLRWDNIVDPSVEGFEIRREPNIEDFGNPEGQVYRGDSTKVEVEDIQERDNTFYIRSYDRLGNYSDYDEIQIVINELDDLPNLSERVTEFFERITVDLIRYEHSYAVYHNNTSDVRNIKISGYELKFEEVGSESETVYTVGDRVNVEHTADRGTEFDIEYRVFDDIGESEWLDIGRFETKSLDNVAQFAQNLRPPELVDEDPATIQDLYEEGALVVWTGDKQLYKLVDGEFTTDFEMDDLTVYQNLVAATVIAGAIGTDELAANSITANKVGTNEIITNSANIAEAVIESANINELQSDKVKVGKQPYRATLPKPRQSTLFHFDRSLNSTDGVRPEEIENAQLTEDGMFDRGVEVVGKLVYDLPSEEVVINVYRKGEGIKVEEDLSEGEKNNLQTI